MDPQAKPTLLIVEDNPVDAKLLYELLVREGAEVTIAKTSREALEVMEKLEPSLVILDLWLSGDRGVDMKDHPVLSWTRNKIGPRPTIFVYTGIESEDIREQLLRSGVAGFFQKGRDLQKLLASVKARMGIG